MSSLLFSCHPERGCRVEGPPRSDALGIAANAKSRCYTLARLRLWRIRLKPIFGTCGEIKSTGSALPETLPYPALRELLNSVGATLKPKVRCVIHISHGAGIPDGGLFTPDQFQKGTEPLPGTISARSDRGEADQRRKFCNCEGQAGFEILGQLPTGARHQLSRFPAGRRRQGRQAGCLGELSSRVQRESILGCPQNIHKPSRANKGKLSPSFCGA